MFSAPPLISSLSLLKNRTADSLHWKISLPSSYSSQEVLEFHSRDLEDVEARVHLQKEGRIRKGFMLGCVPALLEIHLQGAYASCEFQSEKAQSLKEAAYHVAERVLGITYPQEGFEEIVAKEPALAQLVQSQQGLVIPLVPTPMEGLIWAVLCQQIHIPGAIQLRRQLLHLANQKHASGLYCFPDAQAMAHLTEDQLRSIKLSGAKARTIVRLVEYILNGQIPLDQWVKQLQDPAQCQHISETLLAIKGIGPWTVQYVLMRGFGQTDCSLHGDVALRNALQNLWRQEEKVSATQAEVWLAQFSPWRSLVAAHLWIGAKSLRERSSAIP